MTWKPAPALVSILLDANRVAPNRSHATDGIIGDATHQASESDHNPDANGIVHACDVTNDPAGGFDSWAWAQVVAMRMAAGLEHRVHYLVSNTGTGPDLIFNPSVHGNHWVQNGAYKTEHRSHLHVSILYTATAENDQSRFFVAGDQGADEVTPADITAIADALDAKLNRVIGTLQTNMKAEWIPAIVHGTVAAINAAPAGAALDADAIVKAIGKKLST